MATYEELKIELIEISQILEKFPDQVRHQVYELLVSEFLGKKVAKTATTPPLREPNTTESVSSSVSSSHSPKTATKNRSSGKESYALDVHLNLKGDKSIPSFAQFFGEKKPKGAKQFNALAVYYLEKMIGETDVCLDKVYTCYKEVNKKPPNAFKQSFYDTKNKEGWIEINKDGKLSIPHRGSTFVEHDLPPKQKKGDA